MAIREKQGKVILDPIQDLYRQSVEYMNANEKTVLHARMFDDAMKLGWAGIGALFGAGSLDAKACWKSLAALLPLRLQALQTLAFCSAFFGNPLYVERYLH